MEALSEINWGCPTQEEDGMKNGTIGLLRSSPVSYLWHVLFLFLLQVVPRVLSMMSSRSVSLATRRATLERLSLVCDD
jgi:hypothetical protein